MEKCYLRNTSRKCFGSNYLPYFINDMPEVLNCCIKLFADDAKVYSPIKAENDRIRLQFGVNNAQEWAKYGRCSFTPRNVKTSTLETTIQVHNIPCRWIKMKQLLNE